MICLGFNSKEKDICVSKYCLENKVSKVFVLSPDKFSPAFTVEAEIVEWSNIIMYKYFYRLLQEIDNSTLVIMNECLRIQNRYDLTYNCIRNFLNQTKHQIVFQNIPLIDTFDDFMILFDFDTRSRWRREKFSQQLLSEIQIHVKPIQVKFDSISIKTDERTKEVYAKNKRKLIDGLGIKDPHTIPRNLYLLSGKAKLGSVSPKKYYVGRNNRFSLHNLETFKSLSYPNNYDVFEFCHNFLDFSDFITLSKQTKFDVLTSDLRVDRWYFDRYTEWSRRLADAYATLQ